MPSSCLPIPCTIRTHRWMRKQQGGKTRQTRSASHAFRPHTGHPIKQSKHGSAPNLQSVGERGRQGDEEHLERRNPKAELMRVDRAPVKL